MSSCFFFNLESCKIQQNCIGNIKATTNSYGTITVEICHTHHEHTKQLQDTWLSRDKREEIAARLQQGVSRDKILKDIRGEAMNRFDHEFKRHCLAEKNDLERS